MGFNEAWDIAQHIPGWYLEQEARLLYDSACQTPDGIPMLEVGCYAGRSTRILAEAAKARGSKLWVIDQFFHEPDQSREHPPSEDPKTSVIAVLDNAGAEYQLLHSAVADLENTAFPEVLGFIHLDGSHQAADLEIDRARILPRLRHDGMVCFHDYNELAFPDVVALIHSIHHEYQTVAQAGTCIALRKLSLRKPEALTP